MTSPHVSPRDPGLPMSPQTWRKVRWICALTGAWGVLTGYPLFVLISERSESLEGSSTIVQFFGVLLTALVVVTLTEWLRETIRGEDTQRSIGSILVSILLLGIFEVFVMAYEEVSQAGFESPYVLSDIAARVSGEQTPYAFLNAPDIIDPDAILRRLREGLTGQETSSPSAWIIKDLAREMQWTFFPDDVPRPSDHDARLERLRQRNLPIVHDIFPDPAETALLELAVGEGGGSVQPPDTQDPESDALMRKVNVLAGVLQAGNPGMPDRDDFVRERTPVIFMEFGEPVPLALAHRSGVQLSREDLQALLAVELNRELLHFDFYQPDAFRSVPAPAEVKPLLQRHREAQYSGDEARRRLEELTRASTRAGGTRETTATRKALEEQQERSDAALLPLRRLVWLNRRLLEAAFPGAIAQASARADPHKTSLTALGMLWILAGGVLGWVLAHVIRSTHEGRDHPVRRGGLRGLIAGVLIVPAAVVSYVLLVRTVNVGRDLWTLRHELTSLFSLRTASSAFRVSWLAPVASRLEQFGAHVWSAVFVAMLFLGCLALLWIVMWWADVPRWRRNLIFAAAAVIVFVNALLLDVNLVFVFILVGFVWLIPSAFLGMSTPYLQAGSALPKTWGWIAIASGICLVLLTLLRLAWPAIPWWLGVAGVLLIISGILIRNGNKVEDCWPFAALVLAFAVYGASAIAHYATFHGVLANVHELRVRDGSDINLWEPREKPHDTPFGLMLESLAEGESRYTADAELNQAVTDLEEQHEERLQRERTRTARRLELSIVGSLGFWLTVGLLAAWAVVRPPVRHDHHVRHNR